MYELIRRLTIAQLTREQLPLLIGSLLIADVFYKFHSFILESGAFLLTWYALAAVYNGVRSIVRPGKENENGN